MKKSLCEPPVSSQSKESRNGAFVAQNSLLGRSETSPRYQKSPVPSGHLNQDKASVPESALCPTVDVFFLERSSRPKTPTERGAEVTRWTFG